MIDHHTIQTIIDTARIEEVVGDFVSLKRRGTNMIACCPFHNEKTPSFSVSPVKGIYKCFGCGKGGNVVNFIMDHESLSYPDALRWLANKYNIEIAEETPSEEVVQQKALRESILIALSFAQRFFQEQLLETEVGQSVGLSYFKERGFREETIREFGLGYAPEDKHALSSAALKGGYQKDILAAAGLIITYEDGAGYADRFRERVIFPIHNVSGKVIAFAGRILKKDPKAAKYVNSPETEVYHKSDVLYGLFQAKNAIRQQDRCFLTEGYTDVITLHQAGIQNVVASSGTSLTTGQIKLIRRFTENITVLYDGDAAGIKASLRGIDMLLEEGLNVKVALFPDGEDPDSYCQKVGGEAFTAFLQQHSKDFILFKSDLLLKESQDDPIQKVKAVKSIVESISHIPDLSIRHEYIRRTSQMAAMDEQILQLELGKMLKDRRKERLKSTPAEAPRLPDPETELPTDFVAPEQPQTETETLNDEHQEKDLIRLLVNYGAMTFDEEHTVAQFLVKEIRDNSLQLENQLYAAAFSLVETALEKGETVDSNWFFHHQDQLISRLGIELSFNNQPLSRMWKERLDKDDEPAADAYLLDIKSSVIRLKLKKLIRLAALNQEHLAAAEKNGDEAELDVCIRTDIALKEMIRGLLKDSHTVIYR